MWLSVWCRELAVNFGQVYLNGATEVDRPLSNVSLAVIGSLIATAIISLLGIPFAVLIL